MSRPSGISEVVWNRMSPAEQVAISPGMIEDWIELFGKEYLLGLLDSWEDFWARPSQREPEGDWREWLLLTGRGFGKTRTCSEWCYKRTKQGSRSGFLLGRTTEQVRDLQVNGPDGVLAIAEKHGTPWEYKSSEAVVITHTGSRWKMHTSEKPDSVRGPTYDCTIAGTRIDMADGTTKAVEDIRVGDFVYTRFGPRRVTNLFRKVRSCIRLELIDGRVIEGGEEHAVWTRGGGWATLRAIIEEPCLITGAALRDSLGGAPRSRRSSSPARSAERRTRDSRRLPRPSSETTAPTGVSGVLRIERTGIKETFDFTVEGVHEYEAQGFTHHNSGWIEEFATLKSMVGQDGLTAFDNARFTLRAVGELQPRLVLATTPKRVKSVKKMILEEKDPLKQIRLTRGSMTDNLSNLAESFVEGILNRFAGTALGSQEIDGELATDVEGAIFKSAIFNATRIEDERDLPALLRPVLAIDPSVGDGSGDKCGMCVVALSAGTIPTEMKHGNLSVVRNVRHVYVLEDCSIAADPDAWANHAVEVCERYGIIEVIAEGNQGQRLISSMLKARNASLKVRLVNAKVGKEVRAQPVAGLFSQGRAHLVGEHPDLEDVCTTWVPDSGHESPDEMDAMVYGVLHLEPSISKGDPKPYTDPQAFSKSL